MKAVRITNPGSSGMLQSISCPKPVPGPGEVLINVAAAGLNRADLFQVQGRYPLPAGPVAIPGLEISGTIESVGEGLSGFRKGTPVCALLPGGGYATHVLAPEELVMPIPEGMDIVRAAALPEACFTVWKNLFLHGNMAAGESLLVHAGASGIGTAAISLATAFGAKVFATASSPEKRAFCRQLGAVATCAYTDDFRQMVQTALPEAEGVDIILDCLGAPYFQKNLDSLGDGGRLLVIALLNGSRTDINMAPILLKNLTVTGSTLRSAPAEEKSFIAKELVQKAWPLYASGQITPAIDRIFRLEEAQAAHLYMKSNQNVGKILLKV